MQSSNRGAIAPKLSSAAGDAAPVSPSGAPSPAGLRRLATEEALLDAKPVTAPRLLPLVKRRQLEAAASLRATSSALQRQLDRLEGFVARGGK